MSDLEVYFIDSAKHCPIKEISRLRRDYLFGSLSSKKIEACVGL